MEKQLLYVLYGHPDVLDAFGQMDPAGPVEDRLDEAVEDYPGADWEVFEYETDEEMRGIVSRLLHGDREYFIVE